MYSPVRRLAVLLGIWLLALLVGCGPAAAPPAGPAPAAPGGPAATPPTAPVAAPGGAPPGRAAPAKVVLGKTGRGAELQFWPVYVAAAQGYFAQEGLDVELLTVPSAFTLSQALVAGDIQVVGFTVLSMAAAVAGGAPFKHVAASQDVPAIRVVVSPSIGSWADLKGKNVSSGNTAGDYFDVLMRMALAANGLQDGDYTIRTMPGAARMPALETGQVAGGLLSIYDATLALQAGYKSLGWVHEYVKDVVYSGYLVDESWAKANDAVLVGYLRALQRGTNWLFDPANRDEANRIFLAEGPELDLEQVESIYGQGVTEKMLSRNQRPNPQGIDKVMRIAYEQGALPTVPAPETWIDLSYLERASR